MNKEEEKKKVSQLYEIAARERGVILNEVILLEKTIDIFILDYFVPDSNKKNEMFIDVLGSDKINFKNKILIFQNIINKNFPEIKTQHPNLFADLEYVKTERNVHAHYIMDASEKAIKHYEKHKEITFWKFKKDISDEYRKVDNCVKVGTKSRACAKIINAIKTKKISLPEIL